MLIFCPWQLSPRRHIPCLARAVLVGPLAASSGPILHGMLLPGLIRSDPSASIARQSGGETLPSCCSGSEASEVSDASEVSEASEVPAIDSGVPFPWPAPSAAPST